MLIALVAVVDTPSQKLPTRKGDPPTCRMSCKKGGGMALDACALTFNTSVGQAMHAAIPPAVHPAAIREAIRCIDKFFSTESANCRNIENLRLRSIRRK